MGTRFEITAVADDLSTAQAAVYKGIEEITRIESLISSWDQDSQTSMINNNAGIRPVKVDQELFDLIWRAKKISDLTNGAFDISFASINDLYDFDKKEHQLPADSLLSKSVRFIDYQKIVLDKKEQTVFLSESNMKIGFGAIGKGYAANKAKTIMETINGVKGGLVNAAGDLIAWGESGKEKGWSIQISNPKDINKTLGWLNLENMSIVTSGDYEKYFTSNDLRYAHIINPKSGLPTTGIQSVSIICPDAELGDALATSVFVLGEKDGMSLINKLKNVEALIIDNNDKLLSSKNLKLNTY